MATKANYYRLKKEGKCTKCWQDRGKDSLSTIYCEECRRKNVLRGAQRRAKKIGVPFDIRIDDIAWNTMCPVLGIPLDGSTRGNNPSLDRFIPELGYIKGNVFVISYKANTIKNDATVEEVQKVAEWMSKSP